LTAYLQVSGDYDVYNLSTSTSRTVQIDVKQIAGSSVDSIVMIYDSTGQNLLAFNDDGGGYPNSRLIFSTTAGVNYKIVVGSYGANSTGGYQLTVNNYYWWLSSSLVASTTYFTLESGGGSGSGSGVGSLSQGVEATLMPRIFDRAASLR